MRSRKNYVFFPSLSGLEFRVVAYGYPILSSCWRQCHQFVNVSTYSHDGLIRLVSLNEMLDPPLLVLENSYWAMQNPFSWVC